MMEKNSHRFADDQRLIVLCDREETLINKIEQEMEGCCCLVIKTEPQTREKSILKNASRLLQWVKLIALGEMGEETLVQVVCKREDIQELSSRFFEQMQKEKLDSSECIIQFIEIPMGISDETLIKQLKDCNGYRVEEKAKKLATNLWTFSLNMIAFQPELGYLK